jgi:hypothetical protein
MSEFILSNQMLSSAILENQCGIDINKISNFNCSVKDTITSNTPYVLNGSLTTTEKNILCQLSPLPVSEELTNLSLSYGGDQVVALSEITQKLTDYNIGLMGASTSVYANRIAGFAGSVQAYQAALMEYRQAVTSKSAFKVVTRQKALRAFQKMQQQFKLELNSVTSQVKSGHGTPLTNVNRATNIARSSRNVAKLNITSQIQATKLVKFSKQAKFLGNGLAIIDFTSRVGNIHNSYKAGGDWERDLFIESSSFASSAIAGTLAVNAGLAILMIATPVGWVGLIVGGVAVAGVAAATIGMNSYVKENSGDLYDEVMNWILVK